MSYSNPMHHPTGARRPTAPCVTPTVRILRGASTYACISTDSSWMDVLVKDGLQAHESLRATAAEWRARAAHLENRARLVEAAANVLAGPQELRG